MMAVIRSRDYVTVDGVEYLLLSFKGDTTHSSGYLPRLQICIDVPDVFSDRTVLATVDHPDYAGHNRYWQTITPQAWAEKHLRLLG